MQSRRTTVLAVAILGFGLAVPAAFADSVILDTGTGNAPWTVTRTLIGGESVPNTNGGDSAGDSETYTAVDVADPVYANNAWVQANTVGDGNAQWVSWTADAGTNYEGDSSTGTGTTYDPSIDSATSYVYTDTFTLSGAANASVEVSGALVAADNVITGISLEDITANKNVPLTVTDNSVTPTNYYHFPSAFSTLPNSGLFQSSTSQTFTLTVDVVNWDGDRFSAPESTGFLLDGSASTVTPLPKASWALMVLVGGWAACRAGLKRFHATTAVS